MLVLSRQRDETIMIGDNVEITIVDIRGEKVRIGINAPPHVPVHRKEVYLAMKREQAPENAKKGQSSAGVISLANKNKERENGKKSPSKHNTAAHG